MGHTMRPIRSVIAVDDFDPNVSLSSKPFYLTYNGSIKLRNTRGPAISDFNKSSSAKMFEWDPLVPGWRLIAWKQAHIPRCDHCGRTTMAHPLKRPYSLMSSWNQPDTTQPETDCGQWRFLRGRGHKLVDPLTCEYMCRDCQESHG